MKIQLCVCHESCQVTVLIWSWEQGIECFQQLQYFCANLLNCGDTPQTKGTGCVGEDGEWSRIEVKFLVQKIWSEMGEGNMKDPCFEMGGGAPPNLCLIVCLVHSLLSGSSLNTVGSL